MGRYLDIIRQAEAKRFNTSVEDAVIAASLDQRHEFWKLRESIPEAKRIADIGDHVFKKALSRM